MVSAKDAPKSWEDLAEPKWKGKKIIIEARLVPFAMLGTEWGKEKAMELVKKILAQQPIIVQGGTTVANALAGGQVSIAVGTYAYTIEGLKKHGASVDWIATFAAAGADLGRGRSQDRAPSQRSAFLCRLDGHSRGAEDSLLDSRTVHGGRQKCHRQRGRTNQEPKTGDHLGNRKDFCEILEIQRELGKLLGALR